MLHALLVLAACAALESGAGAQNLLPLVPLDGRGTITYFVSDGVSGSDFRPGDRDLAQWALDAWERASDGRLTFVPGPESSALVRVHFVAPEAGQYGEMRATKVDGKRGAEVFIRPSTDALGPDVAERARVDALFRDTIVYLTCLHELGHALGLEHTDEYADIMFFFGYGGDIPAYFGRYRDRLKQRSDIASVSGLSESDVARLRALYEPKPAR